MNTPSFDAFRVLFGVVLALGACTTGSPATDAGTDPMTDASVDPDAGRLPDAGPGCTPDVRLGDSCTTALDCGDGCFCNGVEQCVEGVCVAGEAPCNDSIECTTDVCDEAGKTCDFESDDTACADTDLCNGEERCVPFAGCRPGLRLACADADPCTVGQCDPTEGCVYEVRDLDADGFTDHRCGGDDCFDDPADGTTVYPGAPEVCDNGRDDNCNGLVDYRETSCLGVNDTCASAEVLPGPGVYVRTTRGLAADHALGCRPTGPDAVFRFTLTSPQDVAATLSVDGGSGAVAIRSAASCASGPDSYCDDTSALARDLPAGDYVIVVKTSTPASFTLGLSFLPATPIVPIDVCNDSTFAITASGTFNGFYSDVTDDYQMACRSTTTTAYREAAYRIVLTDPSDVRITARSMGTSTTSTYLSLTRDCTNADASLACVQGSLPEVRRLSLPPGTYYVLVEPSSTTASTFSLTVDIQPAMPRASGDSCGTAIDIGGAIATIPLSTLEFDHGTSCGGTTTSARDANFFFTLTDTRDVLLRTEAGGIHYVALASECGNRVAETFCASGTPRVERRFLRLPAGTYHVAVATNLATGDLTASADILPPTFPPANDTCAAPTPLTDGMVFRGELLAAGDEIASCGPSGSADTVHSLTLTTRRNVTAVARRTDGTSEPIYLGLRTTCDVPSSDLVCTSGVPALLNRTLDPGTYHFIVESAPSFVGSYSLTVYLAEP